MPWRRAPTERGNDRLVAYLVPDGTRPAPPVGDLWDSLRRKLPPALVPSLFVFMDALPMTTSGKVDRSALPDPAARPQAGAEGLP